jgi:hypothetical protein
MSFDSALALLLANASPVVAKVETITLSEKEAKAYRASRAPKTTKAIVESTFVGDGSQTAPATKLPAPVSDPLPSKGTLTAKEFIKARNHAKDRDAHIAAIAGYIGYDVGTPFGVQDSEAIRVAKLELNPAKAGIAFTRGATVSVGGFVKGAADHKARHIQNLKARETLAVDTLIAHNAAANAANDAATRNLYEGLAVAETERLNEIRMDLKRSEA